MASLSGDFTLQAFADTGALLASGRLYTYAYGLTISKTAYTDAAGLVPHTYTNDGAGGQYIALNARGELPAPLYLAAGSYDIALKRPDGSTVWTRRVDPVADASDTVRSDLAAPAKGASLVAYKPPSSGAIDRTVQSALAERVSLLDFGADPTGVVSVNTALAAAVAYINSRTVSPDANGPTLIPELHIPAGTYLLTADAALPPRVRCEGRFSGIYKLTLTNVKRPRILGLSAPSLLLSGVWFGAFEDIYANIYIDGGGTGFGTFWNRFSNITGDVEIDVSNWSVNQNVFHGRGGFKIVDYGRGNKLDCHGNNTWGWDATPGQYQAATSIGQDQNIWDAYYEAGAQISGPFNVFGGQGDAAGPPVVLRHNYILGLYNQIERNSRDFLPLGTANLARGGQWDELDGAGKPVCLSALGSTGVVVGTPYEPGGVGAMFGATFSTAFSGFSITLQPSRTEKFGLVVFFNAAADFAGIEVDRGGGDVSSGGGTAVSVDGANGWRMLRVSGRASLTATTTVRLFAIQGSGAARSMYVGGIFASKEKAALIPSAQRVRKYESNCVDIHGARMQYGSVVQSYVTGTTVADGSAVGGIDVTITYPKPFSSAVAPTFSIVEDNAANSYKFTKARVYSYSTTGAVIRVNFPVDWRGTIAWSAVGPA